MSWYPHNFLTFNLFLLILFMQLTHPFSAGMTMLIQTTLIALASGLISKSFWFSSILFFIFFSFFLYLSYLYCSFYPYTNCLFCVMKKSLLIKKKSSPFECCFDPNGSARIPFSLRFFLIAVIFLIFDVEITLMLPLVSVSDLSDIFFYSMTGLLFLSILLFGLYFEWHSGTLEWSS